MSIMMPTGYVQVEWSQVSKGEKVYEAGGKAGHPYAYGPFEVVEPTIRRAIDPIANTEFTFPKGSIICVPAAIQGQKPGGAPLNNYSNSWPVAANPTPYTSPPQKTPFNGDNVLDALYNAFLSRMTAALPNTTSQEHAAAAKARDEAIKLLDALIANAYKP